MIFIEFTSSNYPRPGAKHYFVGDATESILADTAGGTHFGFSVYSAWREITIEEARKLELGHLKLGIEAVERGTKSYKLDPPER